MPEALPSIEQTREPEPEDQKDKSTKAKPPLKIVRKPEEKEQEQIYVTYSAAKEAGLFEPGTILEMMPMKQLRYPQVRVEGIDEKTGFPLVQRIDFRSGQDIEEPFILHPSRYHNFKKIDSNKENSWFKKNKLIWHYCQIII